MLSTLRVLALTVAALAVFWCCSLLASLDHAVRGTMALAVALALEFLIERAVARWRARIARLERVRQAQNELRAALGRSATERR